MEPSESDWVFPLDTITSHPVFIIPLITYESLDLPWSLQRKFEKGFAAFMDILP